MEVVKIEKLEKLPGEISFMLKQGKYGLNRMSKSQSAEIKDDSLFIIGKEDQIFVLDEFGACTDTIKFSMLMGDFHPVGVE